MKKLYNLLVLCCLLLVNGNLVAQTQDKIEEPQYPGGRKELLKYMEEHMVHPADMRELGSGDLEGKYSIRRSLPS